MNRRSSLVLVMAACAAGATLLAAGEKAAEPSLLFVHVEHVKPSAIVEYEAVTKEIVAELGSSRIDPAKISFQTVSGPELGYVYVSPLESFGAIDAMRASWMEAAETMGIERWKELAARSDAAVESRENLVSRHRPDLSYVPERPDVPWEEAKFIGYSFYHVRPGHEEKIAEVTRRYIALHRELGTGLAWQTYQGLLGGDLPVLVVAVPARSSSDYHARAETSQQLLGAEGQKLGLEAMAHLRKIERREGWLRPDLSYPSPARTEDG